jgi:glycosyltransferase involved in cell wall biosynthesis
MKVLQVIPRFNPSLGGGVDVVYNISKQLALRGHDVTVATTDYLFDADYARTIEDLGVEVIPFRHLFNYCLYIPSPDLKAWCKAHISDFDIVHLNGTRSYQNSVVMNHAVKSGVPIVLQAHGSIMRIVERKGIKWLYDQVWGDKLLTNASAFIALSHSEAEAHQRMGVAKEKIHVLPNGVDLEKFKDLPKKGEFRGRYSIKADEKVVLYLGRLHKSKGVDLLVEAFKILESRLNNVTLVIVGPDGGIKGALQERVEKYGINDKVIFTGLVPEQEKYAAFIDSDVFVTPKFYGFPITFAESCACGLPIVTTNEGDCLEWIDNSVGYISGYTPAQMSDAILKVLVNDENRGRLGRNAREMVIKALNWNWIAEQVETTVYSPSIEGFKPLN